MYMTRAKGDAVKESGNWQTSYVHRHAVMHVDLPAYVSVWVSGRVRRALQDAGRPLEVSSALVDARVHAHNESMRVEVKLIIGVLTQTMI